MVSIGNMGHPTKKDRLLCALALSEAEADSVILSGVAAVDTAKIATRVGLNKKEVERLLSSPSALENHRMNPNRITRLQMLKISGISRERVRTMDEGRPYFSIEELEEATGLQRPYLEDLFQIPSFKLYDNVTKQSTKLEPVSGSYILSRRQEYESPEVVRSLGFSELSGGPDALVRVLVPDQFEETEPLHRLKAVFKGQLLPVLRDAEGFDRYLVPGSIDVWFRRNVPLNEALDLLQKFELSVSARYAKAGYYKVELQNLPADRDILRATLEKIEKINEHPNILFAEPDQVGFDDFGPDMGQEVLDFEDATVGSRAWNQEMIELEAAHVISEGTEDVTIFIIDSGMRLDHPDLDDSLRPDWTGLDLNFDVGIAESELSPNEQVIAHGTSVAGISAGRAITAVSGSRGVAPGCWILPVKISGTPFSQSYGFRAVAIRESMDYVEAGKRGVINISWSTNGEHIGIREALIDASEKGLAIVTSAGNYRTSETQVADKPHYPSGYAFLPGSTEADVTAHKKIKGLCSVGALNASKVKASYSYYGSKSITVMAPGGESGGSGIGIFLASTPQNYRYGSGTSFAAPQVSGLISLLFSLATNLTAQRAIEIICETSANVDTLNPNYVGMLGTGLIDVRKTIESLRSSESPTPKTPDTHEPPASDPEVAVAIPLNINTATTEALIALPLIGEWTASAIIAYRQEHGLFSNIWDLAMTGVIDTWTIQQIQQMITTKSESTTLLNKLPSTNESSSVPPANSRLNINTAVFEEFVALPLIGEWTASAIIAYRQENGPFESVWGLMSTGVLDAWTVQQLDHLITTIVSA